MVRTPLRSITARASGAVVEKVTPWPVATPCVDSVVKLRWVCMSITGNRGLSTGVSGTWSMLFGRKSRRLEQRCYAFTFALARPLHFLARIRSTAQRP
jgi:hypothetical protein